MKWLKLLFIFLLYTTWLRDNISTAVPDPSVSVNHSDKFVLFPTTCFADLCINLSDTCNIYALSCQKHHYKPPVASFRNTWRILHECSCFIEFIKRVGGKEIKCEACRAFYLFFATSLINSIIQDTNVRFYLSYDI